MHIASAKRLFNDHITSSNRHYFHRRFIDIQNQLGSYRFLKKKKFLNIKPTIEKKNKQPN